MPSLAPRRKGGSHQCFRGKSLTFMLLSVLVGYVGGSAGVDLFVIRFINTDFFVGVVMIG